MLVGRALDPLRSPDYRRLWFAQLISVIGDKVDQIALGILVYAVTDSELQMGIVLAISMLPAALFGMVAGAYVDRLDRRRTMIASDVLRAGLVLAIPFAAEHSMALVYGIAFLVATVSLFFEPAKLSLIPEIVPDEQLMAANSLDNATVSAAELVGLAFAAGLVATVGYRTAFYLDAATFLLSAIFVGTIRHRHAPETLVGERPAGVFRDVAEGLRYIAHHEVLRDLLPIYSVAMAGVAASVTFVYVLALDRFVAGASGLALLDGAITVGLLLGSVIVGRAGTGGARRMLLWGLSSFAVLLAVTVLLPSVAWAVPLFIMMGIANMFFYVPMVTILQTVSTASMRGRAFAAKQTLTRIMSVIGFIGAGALSEAVGFPASVLVVSTLVGLMALLGWTRPLLRAA